MKFAIADDVYVARKAMEKLILEWDNGSIICCSCGNGEDVIHAMEQEPVDILITDIRMPGLDGLQLSEVIEKRFPFVDVILVSGYATFEYARTALYHGVRDYLLKPLKREELFSVLNKVRSGREEDKKLREKIEEAKKYTDSFLLLQYLSRENSPESMLPSELLELKGGMFFIIRILGTKHSDRELGNRLQTLCNPNDVLFLDILHGGMGIVSSCGIERSQSVYDKKIREIQQLKIEDDFLVIGVSSLTEGLKSLQSAYSQSLQAISLGLVNRKDLIHIYSGRQGKALFTKEDLHVIRHLLNAQKVREVKEFCLKKLATFDAESVSVFQLEQAYQALLGICYSMGNRDYKMGNKRIYRPLWDFESPELWLDYICSLAISSTELYPEVNEGTIIEDIQQFLEKNYYCEISLNELAATRYYMNPNYLSRLFKAKTGMGFSRYLLGLRMNKAEQLLKTGEMSIHEVALLVGYTSPSYFIHNFKKYFGRTPGDRKNRRRSDLV